MNAGDILKQASLCVCLELSLSEMWSLVDGGEISEGNFFIVVRDLCKTFCSSHPLTSYLAAQSAAALSVTPCSASCHFRSGEVTETVRMQHLRTGGQERTAASFCHHGPWT